MAEVIPFRIDVPEAELADLRRRLRQTRWPEREPVADWSQGVPLAYLRELCGYWADGYDWRATEALLNAWPQFRTVIDGLPIHFIHARSPRPDALPLVLTHGPDGLGHRADRRSLGVADGAARLPAVWRGGQ
jgi:hypothetical protein